MIVDRVLLHFMSLIVEDEPVTNEGLGMEVGRCKDVFYSYDGMIGSRDPEWLQGVINVIIRLFIRVEFMANVAKSKTTTC